VNFEAVQNKKSKGKAENLHSREENFLQSLGVEKTKINYSLSCKFWNRSKEMSE
jgi:hypothetical protein